MHSINPQARAGKTLQLQERSRAEPELELLQQERSTKDHRTLTCTDNRSSHQQCWATRLECDPTSWSIVSSPVAACHPVAEAAASTCSLCSLCSSSSSRQQLLSDHLPVSPPQCCSCILDAACEIT
jgi:hypothetical protein